jgi:hypothetical protein
MVVVRLFMFHIGGDRFLLLSSPTTQHANKVSIDEEYVLHDAFFFEYFLRYADRFNHVGLGGRWALLSVSGVRSLFGGRKCLLLWWDWYTAVLQKRKSGPSFTDLIDVWCQWQFRNSDADVAVVGGGISGDAFYRFEVSETRQTLNDGPMSTSILRTTTTRSRFNMVGIFFGFTPKVAGSSSHHQSGVATTTTTRGMKDAAALHQ